MLSAELADKIVHEVRKLLNEDIIVVDTTGTIISSTVKNRVGTFHEGALKAVQKRDTLIISSEDEKHLIGVKAGINLPVFFIDDVIGVIGITGDPIQVSPFGEIIRKMTELLIQENYYSEQFDWQSRALEGFLFDWLQLDQWNESFTNRARLLSINLEVERQVAIAQFSPLHPLAYRECWQAVSNWHEKHHDDLIIRRGNDQIIYIIGQTKHQRSQRTKIQRFSHLLKTLLKREVVIGVGQLQSSLSVKTSYKQAERALSAAKQKRSSLVFDEDLKIESVLADIKHETKMDFLQKTLLPIIHETDLLITLREYMTQNQSLKNTAQSLHIHINTLHYRLKKVQEMTGLHIANSDDFFMIYLALHFLDEHTKKIIK